MPTHPVLIAGEWRAAKASGTFCAENPATGETLPAALQNKNPNGKMWRLIDGNWTHGDIAG